MGMVLMCKNRMVYNIDTEQVYNRALLPGYMAGIQDNYTFKEWLKLRYSSNTNSLARQLKGITFGQGNRARINKETMALSLSDSYWIKNVDDPILFEQCSPYLNRFWAGEGKYEAGLSIPTLYTNGYLNKEWVNEDILVKYGDSTIIEYECSRLCSLAGIPCAEIKLLPNNSGIAISNITNSDYMLESADMSGRLDPDDFNNETIIKLFGIDGLNMLLVDAVFANGDRHAGNFGWLRNTNTGQYISMAPLYDFDHALDSKLSHDMLISDFIDTVKNWCNASIITDIRNKLNIIINNTTNEIFKMRANNILMGVGMTKY